MRYTHAAAARGDKIVVVIGGGFGGLNAAKVLAKRPGVQVILIDKKNHHVFQPLLYQVATAALNPSDIAMPIRAQFPDEERIAVHWGVVKSIALKEKFITVTDVALQQHEEVEITYDYLIVACGAQHSYFGHPEWEPYAPGLKTLEHATEIRRRFLSAFERAENATDPALRAALMTFVIVGAGPTGVEIAGAMAEISRTVLVDDFRHIDPKEAKVILIEAGPRVLPVFSESLSKKAAKDLRDLGVDVRTSTFVENVGPEGVIAGGEFIPSMCMIWAAGVEASKLEFSPPQERDRAGRIRVAADLSLPEFSEVFVIGDMAAVELAPGRMVPGVAPAAIQQGRFAASCILASLTNRKRKSFKYIDKGMMATIGKKRAIIQTGGLEVSGIFAWFGWLFVHVLYLVGFRNRMAVLIQWVWSYVFAKRGARLITSDHWESH
jgi:NADH dehydrogenase